MEKMKEELYAELHIFKNHDKAIINELISNKYSNWIMNNYNELKDLVKASYKSFKLNKAIELFNKHKNTIFINGMLIFNYDSDENERVLIYNIKDDSIDCWVDGALVFNIRFDLIRTIETKHDILYREDETLLW